MRISGGCRSGLPIRMYQSGSTHSGVDPGVIKPGCQPPGLDYIARRDPRRDGRVAEGARLESVYTGNRIVGSNPTPSATDPIQPRSPLLLAPASLALSRLHFGEDLWTSRTADSRVRFSKGPVFSGASV